MSYFRYSGSKLKEISFPLGGIGAGCIGLGGNGRLMDWEIFNRPNKNTTNGYSFFAIRAVREDNVAGPRVLIGDYEKMYMGEGQENNRFGSGINRETMAGFPHFQDVSFTGKYPFAEIEMSNDNFPFSVKLEAWNPFIPLNDKDSSIPAAIFSFAITNTSGQSWEGDVLGTVYNPHQKKSINRYVSKGKKHSLLFDSQEFTPNEADYGNLALSTMGEMVSHQTYLYRGRWFDAMTILWEDFSKGEPLCDRVYEQPYDDNNANLAFVHRDAGCLSNHFTLEAGESKTVTFIISWFYPNCANYWNPMEGEKGTKDQPYATWKNYYATIFDSSLHVADYIWREYSRLHNDTRLFCETLFSSTIPDYVLDAVAGNMSILKSPTCLRLTDGTLYGFEGCHAQFESCEGSCTHVWSYDQTTPFLFPALARSMHDIYYKYCGDGTGKYMFRMMLPPKRTFKIFPKHNGPDRAAVDGQMGSIIRIYRDWKLSGDTDWLRSIWTSVKGALEYAWSANNEYGWDKDGDGILEGRQHNTLDIELFGANAYLTGLYHAALLASGEMADAMGDTESGVRYRKLFRDGSAWLSEHLFNGEYFVQDIVLTDESRYPVDAEIGEVKNQIGIGCHIDQTIAQWHSDISGLGMIFDEDQLISALQSIYNYNFVTLGEYPNPCRNFAVNDEKGVVICTWPKGGKPIVPVPYSGECMNGMEYQAACNMIYHNMVKQGLDIVKAVRSRFDGEKRNPWNEFESGSNYARSMAAYSLMIALSGFRFDLTNNYLGFNPKLRKDDFNCFWSVGSGWGRYEQTTDKQKVKLLYGTLNLRRFGFAGDEKLPYAVLHNDNCVQYHLDGDNVCLTEPVMLQAGDTFAIKLRNK